MGKAPPQLEKSWQEALQEEWDKPYLKDLAEFVSKERAGKTPIYPSKQEVFAAFEKTPFDQVKVVVVGQDPYHGPHQAHGLSFSVKPGIALPPSLANIYKELYDDLAIAPASHGCLSYWAKQGVLLLNATLTVRHNAPGSHQGRGWEIFTDKVVEKVSAKRESVVFVLWGKSAEAKCIPILKTASHHFVITSPHPSPFSAHRGFFGSRPFSKINDLFKKQERSPIDWQLPAMEANYGQDTNPLNQ